MSINSVPVGHGGMPAVSVIIPTFNRAELVGDAIDSVLRQSFSDFELIVIDDGSTDRTAEVVGSFSDARLVFVRQENKGRSFARNRALRMARGKYIAFLDSDDIYLKEKLQMQVEFMEAHPLVGMIYTSAYCVDDRGAFLDKQHYFASAEGNIYKDIAFFRPVTITLPTVMVRREVFDAVGGFDEAMDRFEDTDLWRRIAKSHQVGVIKESTCVLRTHGENALQSQNPGKIAGSIDYYVAKIFREDADIDPSFLKQGASGLYEYYGSAFMSVPGWRHHGIALLKKSAGLSPRRVVAIVFAGARALAGSMLRQCTGRAK